jgi:hypothetical protein
VEGAPHRDQTEVVFGQRRIFGSADQPVDA